MCFDVPWKTDRNSFKTLRMTASFSFADVVCFYTKFLSYFDDPCDVECLMCLQAALCHVNGTKLFRKITEDLQIQKIRCCILQRAVKELASRFIKMYEALVIQVQAEECAGNFNYFETQTFQVP